VPEHTFAPRWPIRREPTAVSEEARERPDYAATKAASTFIEQMDEIMNDPVERVIATPRNRAVWLLRHLHAAGFDIVWRSDSETTKP
jgi:ribosomal protein S11